uniref:Uncharacterized protein n=1 Tax=Acrobeloides nanus TaxID=290746 RepID=A0A914D907_9BILA
MSNTSKSCEDLRVELDTIKSLCAKHESLCTNFEKWKSKLEQNDAQFEILNETARALRSRNKMLKDLLSKRPDPESVQRLQREINAIQIQVDIWIREISEIRENREQLDVEFAKLRSQLQRSMTNLQIAHLDIEAIERHHQERWRNFLYKSQQSISPLGQSARV